MLRKRRNRLLHKSMSITITSGVIVMLLLLSSCGGKKKAMGEAITERDSLPMMTTLGVTTLISDSGVTRYRVNTEEWSVYDRKKPSYWAFEKGVYLEQFDSIFRTIDSTSPISLNLFSLNPAVLLFPVGADHPLPHPHRKCLRYYGWYIWSFAGSSRIHAL